MIAQGSESFFDVDQHSDFDAIASATIVIHLTEPSGYNDESIAPIRLG